MAMLSTRHQPWKRIFTLFVLPFFLLCALIARFRHRDPVLRAASAAPVNDLQRIAKASMLYGQYNNLYERALRSHARHAQRWGYPMHVLRHDISVGFWSKPTYLLSLVLQELRKPAEERVDWLLWVDGDTIILNDAIPMEIFLPPADMGDIHLLATKDQNGLNTGIIYLHVHAWTVSMLVDTLAYPMQWPELDLGRNADQEAMARLFEKDTGGPEGKGYKENIIYLPRPWINTYQFENSYEGSRGDLLVHFPGLGDLRWELMAQWLNRIESTPEDWQVPLRETDYLNKTEAFWANVREAKKGIASGEQKLSTMPAGTLDEIESLEAVRYKIDSLKTLLLQGTGHFGSMKDQLRELEV